MMSFIEAIVIAIVEGLTEFLPVSSTGHMIITSSILGIEKETFTKVFTVAIQSGAILAVVTMYFKRFFQSLKFYYKLFVAFIPAAIIGLLLKDYIDILLGNVIVVAVSLLLGGIILVFVDKWFINNETEENNTDISYFSALIIGFFQCISMIPGVSRSAATIVGGMTRKMNRKSAAEFSFFLAVPTMFAATALELFEIYEEIKTEQLLLLAVGCLVAYIVAIFAIKGFISILTKFGFKAFGYYRIALGLAIIILIALGFDLKIID